MWQAITDSEQLRHWFPAGTGAGYHVCLDHLETLLDSGPATSQLEHDTDLEREYEALLRA